VAQEIENILSSWDSSLIITRDKTTLKYKSKILDYMRNLARGQYIIVIISKEYLKSKNCLFELLEIAKQGDFYERIFPVVLNDANIYDPIIMCNYLEHWEKEYIQLDRARKKIHFAHSEEQDKAIDLYREICEKFSSLTGIITDMNVLTPDEHRDTDFKPIRDLLAKRMEAEYLRVQPILG
jgi:hypothetical protein